MQNATGLLFTIRPSSKTFSGMRLAQFSEKPDKESVPINLMDARISSGEEALGPRPHFNHVAIGAQQQVRRARWKSNAGQRFQKIAPKA